MEKLRRDCGMEHGRDARVAPGVSAYVPETGDDEVLPDAPRFEEAPKDSLSSPPAPALFEEAPKDSLSSPPAPALFSVEPVPLTRYCPHVTKEACMEARGAQRCCEDVHFRRIKHPQTAREPNADCHFLQVRGRDRWRQARTSENSDVLVGSRSIDRLKLTDASRRRSRKRRFIR